MRARRGPAMSAAHNSPRARIVAGMIASAARDGYAEASIAHAIAHAHVSRPTFYEHFADKQACFLAAHQQLAGALAQDVRAAIAAGPPQDALAAALGALGAFAAREPDHARLLLVATLAAGPAAQDARDRAVAQMTTTVEDSLARAAPDAPAPDAPTGVALGTAHWLLGRQLRQGNPELAAVGAELGAWVRSYTRPLAQHRWRALQPGPPPPRTPHVAALEPTAPAPLRPGRPAGDAPDVARNQRLRIMLATADTAVEKGYTATTITDIAAAAGVSRKVFYSHFADKQEAFLAIHELTFQQLITVVASAFSATAADWPERIWNGGLAITQWYAANPTLSHVAFVESYAVGAPAIERVDLSVPAFGIFLRQGYADAPQQPPERALEAITDAIFEICYRYARSGIVEQLGRLVYPTAYLVVAPFHGPARAGAFVEGKLAAGRRAEGGREQQQREQQREQG